MFEITSQERLALIVLAVLLTGGATARHLVAREQASAFQNAVQAADTIGSGTPAALRGRVAQEVDLQRIRSMPLRPGETIDPNLAPPEQLARLPRVGPALAGRIVAHREANGPFRTLEDLRTVSGIGPALLEAIGPFIDLSSAPPAPSAGAIRPPAGSGSSVRPAAPSGAAAGRQQVDINRATAAELQSLPGIGPVIAERIVDYRQANGPFRSFQELERVSGIGPRLRERLEEAARLGS
jgi:competence protein ComEA